MATPADAALNSIVPADMKNLRACLFCSLVKTFQQFEMFGCENCTFLEMEEDKDKVNECTSVSFEGMIALMKPEESWVAKWQRLRSSGRPFHRGVYAISINGRLPSRIVANLEKQGIHYVSRDRSERA